MKRFFATALLLAATTAASAQTLAPPYNTAYTIFNVGSVPGVPNPYGGLTLLDGDNDTLLIGGAANQSGGAIFAVALQRNECNNITGFASPATLYATCPNIDGGLAYGPGGVLFATGYPINMVHQFEPGSTAPDRSIDAGPLTGGNFSLGSLTFVPSQFTTAGHLKLLMYSSGTIHDSVLTPDGNGTYNLGSAPAIANIGGGPEGLFYVPPGSPLFPNPTMLVCLYGLNRVDAFDVDSAGNPIISTQRTFISGLGGVEGAYIDPQSGDFIFSTFAGNSQVISVRGFARFCDGVDFNNDGLFPDTADIDDYLSVFSGGPCSTGDCGDIDFNNDCLFPDTLDIDSLLSVFSGGGCL